MNSKSLFGELRSKDKPNLPKLLTQITLLEPKELEHLDEKVEIQKIFPHLKGQKLLTFIKGSKKQSTLQRVGVLFSGGQAAGGHNVVIGLFEALKEYNSENKLFGFLNGPDGLLNNEWVELKENLLDRYLNQGGFDLLGSSRTKFETNEQFYAIAETVKELQLTALVVIGGDDSNTNAVYLAEFFKKENIHVTVVGVPKTIDGDLKNKWVETSFGFDTACKMYSETIGSIGKDALSAKKYYYFIKLMGRSASHVTLECALETHPNLTLISEEVEAKGKTLKMLVDEIADMIVERAKQGKDYGVILIPEGILEFIPEIKSLLSEIISILTSEQLKTFEVEAMEGKEDMTVFIQSHFSKDVEKVFASLPDKIKAELLQARDPHGNVQVSKIDTEELFIGLVKKELRKRKNEGKYIGKFNPQDIFCGYEGRSCYPSLFDARYCFALGYMASLLIQFQLTGYMTSLIKLNQDVDDWQPVAVPIVHLMHIEERNGDFKAVVKKAMVDLKGDLFKTFENKRDNWILFDDYVNPGPIQFYGPSELTDKITFTLKER